jgi:hypothetical protein
MEDRPNHFQSDTEKLNDSIHMLRLRVAELEGRMSQMPTMMQMAWFMLAAFVAGGLLRQFGT